MIRSRWWVLAYGAGTAALALVLLGVLRIDAEQPDGQPGRIVLGLALLAALLAAYALLGRRAHEGDRSAIAFTVAVIVISGALTAVAAPLAIVQFLAYPTVWSVSASWRAGMLASLGVAVAVALGFLVSIGTEPDDLAQLAVTQLVSAGFSVVMGTWISRIAALGEERGRLLDELSAAQEQLAALHRDAGVVEERGRLARELHDTIAQDLTGLVMLGQRARRELEAGTLRDEVLELIESGARGALAETRSLVAASAPVELAGGGLVDALDRLVRRFARETGIALGEGVDVRGTPRALARDDEVVLLRCAQEGLANVRKHASASAASIGLDFGAEDTMLYVRDDGRGFEVDAVDPGFGLAGLRARLALVGGTLQVDGTPGAVELRATLPVRDGGLDGLDQQGVGLDQHGVGLDQQAPGPDQQLGLARREVGR